MSRGWVADASLSTTPLSRIAAISNAIRTHISYNYELLVHNKGDARFVGIEFVQADPTRAILAAGAAIHKAGDERTAAALYSTAIAREPDRVDFNTYNELGKIRLKEGRSSDAAEYFSRAAYAANRPGETVPQKLRGETFANLGLAQERAGSVTPAIESYTHAILHGSGDANKRASELIRREVSERSGLAIDLFWQFRCCARNGSWAR